MPNAQHGMSNAQGGHMYDGKFDLEERLIEFAVRIIKVAGSLPNTLAGQHIAEQILRSGTSSAANYGEAQGAESRADFVHKIRIALKELRETKVWLRIIVRAGLISSADCLQSLLKENDEVISILFKSVETARKNEKSGEKVSRPARSAE
ncbi:MAG: four helix bundle protein [Kiritimatiellae bacterium]|nr:four helix bundle protein [Kiritimatiellia bacterium]